MIVFDKVSKSFGSNQVLKDISFKIKPGEFVSVVGPSGVGKSTLIHALIGAEKVDQGKIHVDDYEVHRMSERALQQYRRRVGMIFQDYKLIDKKNVFENVAFALEVCGLPETLIHDRVEDVLKTVNLTKQLRNFPGQLSGGEKQRTAIARALVHKPHLVIADEPTGNLDPKTAKEIVDLLVEINKTGKTVILATHNKELVNHIKKRVIRLDDGKIKSDVLKGKYH